MIAAIYARKSTEATMTKILAAFGLALFVSGPALAHVVELKTGQRVEGTLTQATPASVVIEVGGQTITFDREKVRAIYFGTPSAGSSIAAPMTPVVAAAVDAIQALKGLHSVTAAGIVYREYATRVLDAKPKVDRYIEQAEPSPTREAVARATRYYVAASIAWNASLVKNVSGFDGLEAQLAGCQDDRPPKTPGPLDRIKLHFFLRDPVELNRGLSEIWACASDQLAEAEKLLAEKK